MHALRSSHILSIDFRSLMVQVGYPIYPVTLEYDDLIMVHLLFWAFSHFWLLLGRFALVVLKKARNEANDWPTFRV